MKNILIVGAGAVGQVYGYQFAQAGHKVTFLIKEKYQKNMEKGLVFYNLGKDKEKQQPFHFSQFETVTSWDQAGIIGSVSGWDQVYLCISSTALASFDFQGLNKVISRKTTIAMMQPGPKDFQLAANHLPEQQIVQGMITLISYTAPLTTESVPEPGIAYWLPPMVATPFSGFVQHQKALIDTFKSAGMRATSKRNLRTSTPYPTAALMAFLTALEVSDWKFERLRENEALQNDMIRALKQSFMAISEDNGSSQPFWRHFITPSLIRLLLKVSPKTVPLDLETYFEAHFMKLKDQTKLLMRTYVETANQYGLDAKDLVSLNQLTG